MKDGCNTRAMPREYPRQQCPLPQHPLQQYLLRYGSGRANARVRARVCLSGSACDMRVCVCVCVPVRERVCVHGRRTLAVRRQPHRPSEGTSHSLVLSGRFPLTGPFP